MKRRAPIARYARIRRCATLRRTRSASSSPKLRYAKGQTRTSAKRQKTKIGRVVRRNVCDAVKARDGGCRIRIPGLCRWSVYLQVHEEPPRSLGGDPHDPSECLTACKDCHEERTRNRIEIHVLDGARGTAGPIEIVRGDRRWITEPVGLIA